MVSKKAFAWENVTTLGLCLLVLAGLSACGSGSGSNSAGSGTSGIGGNPLPSISSLSPASATAGTAGFTLTVTGTGFISTSAVEWNGSARTTSFVSSTELQADISTSDIAKGGSATVTVTTPPPGGGISGGSNFTIAAFASGTTLTTVSQAANDMVWDPVNQVIYLSVPSAASANGNTISILNPSTGVIASSKFAGSSPDVLALSAGSQYLYVALDGSSTVQRFTLPSLALDINYSLGADSFFGPYVAMDLQAAPQDAHTTAVTLGCPQVSPEEQGGMVIYDDATPRPTKAPGFGGTGDLFDSVQWGSDDTAIYASNYEDTGFDFYNLSVNSSGVTLNHDYGNDFPGFYLRIHYDSGTQLVYGDDGNVVTPSTGLPAGTFAASGWMVPDSTLNAAFFLGQTQSQQGGTDFTIESFNLTQFTPVGSITIPSVTGNPLRLIRWGQNGLAFNTDGGEVYLISGSFVSSVPGTPKNNMNEPSLEPVRRPASFRHAILTHPK